MLSVNALYLEKHLMSAFVAVNFKYSSDTWVAKIKYWFNYFLLYKELFLTVTVGKSSYEVSSQK